MKEIFLKEIERFIEKTYETEAVVFQEIVREQEGRSITSLCYYWDPTLESDMYEVVRASKSHFHDEIVCVSVGRFSESTPNLEDVAHVMKRLLHFN